jgi:large subunit ribosomal protein L21
MESAMFALVQTSGRQFWVRPGEKIVVDRMEAEVGASVVLDRVLLLGTDPVSVGTPVVPGAQVEARVLSHDLGEKVRSFKYTHRRRSRHRRASRAYLTTLEIIAIKEA